MQILIDIDNPPAGAITTVKEHYGHVGEWVEGIIRDFLNTLRGEE